MKYLLFLPLLFICCTLLAQDKVSGESAEKVILDNEKMKVIQHFSMPNGDVCGEGIHRHEPHLTVVLTDAKVRITPQEGESQIVEVKSGTSIWFESETHSVTNLGDQPTKMILIYLKE
jgi:mannose-6-phosphate isomerase-like protein (cupin superfamily)